MIITFDKNLAEIEAIYERELVYGDNPTGAISVLKKFGWKDKIKIDQTTSGKKLQTLISRDKLGA